jgi:hypothetical protein
MDLEWTHETCKFVMLAQKQIMPQPTKMQIYSKDDWNDFSSLWNL